MVWNPTGAPPQTRTLPDGRSYPVNNFMGGAQPVAPQKSGGIGAYPTPPQFSQGGVGYWSGGQQVSPMQYDLNIVNGGTAATGLHPDARAWGEPAKMRGEPQPSPYAANIAADAASMAQRIAGLPKNPVHPYLKGGQQPLPASQLGGAGGVYQGALGNPLEVGASRSQMGVMQPSAQSGGSSFGSGFTATGEDVNTARLVAEQKANPQNYASGPSGSYGMNVQNNSGVNVPDFQETLRSAKANVDPSHFERGPAPQGRYKLPSGGTAYTDPAFNQPASQPQAAPPPQQPTPPPTQSVPVSQPQTQTQYGSQSYSQSPQTFRSSNGSMSRTSQTFTNGRAGPMQSSYQQFGGPQMQDFLSQIFGSMGGGQQFNPGAYGNYHAIGAQPAQQPLPPPAGGGLISAASQQQLNNGGQLYNSANPAPNYPSGGFPNSGGLMAGSPPASGIVSANFRPVTDQMRADWIARKQAR